MGFFVFIWRNLSRRPARSVLTMVALSVGVAAVVALVGVSDSFSRQFRDLYKHREIDLVVQNVGSSQELNNGLPEEMAKRIKEVHDVKAVMGGLMDTVSFEDNGLPMVIINGWRADSPLFQDRDMLPGGRFPKEGEHHKVIIGSVLADALGKKVGDTMRIYDTDVEIIGIFKSAAVYERASIATLLSDMQDFMGRPNQVTGFIITTDIPTDAPDRAARIATIGKQIEKKLGDNIAAIPSDAFIEGVGAIKVSKGAAWAISAIALVIGAIVMLNTMVMSIYERIREIGTLRAIGWRRMRVVWMVVCESVLLSIGGWVVGSLCALAMTRLASKLPMVSGLIDGDIAPLVFIEGLLLALLIGFAGALYPAYWGANLSPNEAMRRK